MVEKTVTVGDTEVEITETEDGFEVEEANTGPEPGVYLRAETIDDRFRGGEHGCQIPINADYLVKQKEESSEYEYAIAWNSDDNVDDDLHDGSGSEFTHDECREFRNQANVHELSIVTVSE